MLFPKNNLLLASIPTSTAEAANILIRTGSLQREPVIQQLRSSWNPAFMRERRIFTTTETTTKSYPIEEAVRAQKALRTAAGLGPEMFPLQAFVGMISDEIDSLRKAGRSDEQIAALVCRNSSIQISGDEIAQSYASREQRHRSPR